MKINIKRFVLSFVVILFLYKVSANFIEHVIMDNAYFVVEVSDHFRTLKEMQDKNWIVLITDVVWTFLFTYIFVKGYEDKGVMEGMRFGFIIGMFYPFVMAYRAFVLFPIPYSIPFQWFFYGLIQCVILGFVASLLYKPKEEF